MADSRFIVYNTDDQGECYATRVDVDLSNNQSPLTRLELEKPYRKAHYAETVEEARKHMKARPSHISSSDFARWRMECLGLIGDMPDETAPAPKVPTAPAKPKKPPPGLPVEVHNPRKVDTALAMQAMRDLCRGVK